MAEELPPEFLKVAKCLSELPEEERVRRLRTLEKMLEEMDEVSATNTIKLLSRLSCRAINQYLYAEEKVREFEEYIREKLPAEAIEKMRRMEEELNRKLKEYFEEIEVRKFLKELEE